MEFTDKVPLKRIFLLTSIICIGSFFALLLSTNAVNRNGITTLNDLNSETAEYKIKLHEIEVEIATYSSLRRVEPRALELGFDNLKNIEYIK